MVILALPPLLRFPSSESSDFPRRWPLLRNLRFPLAPTCCGRALNLCNLGLFWPLPEIQKPLHFSFAPPLRTPPHGHTLNSAIVRLRLYRFSERKVFRELLMKTVTVGAESPVTSILPRPGWVCSPLSRLTPALLPPPPPPPLPLLDYQPHLLLPT